MTRMSARTAITIIAATACSAIGAAAIAASCMPGLSSTKMAIAAGTTVGYILLVDHMLPWGRNGHGKAHAIERVMSGLGQTLRDRAIANEGWYLRVVLTVAVILALEAVIEHVLPGV